MDGPRAIDLPSRSWIVGKIRVRKRETLEVSSSGRLCCLITYDGDAPVNRLPETRHSLLLRLADASDGVAWREFLEVYERAIFRFACSRGLQPADAEDVTQRVLAAVVDKVQSWEPEVNRGSFGAWLFRVTRNLAAKTWNDRMTQPLQYDELDAPEAIPGVSASDATLFQTEYRRALFHWAADRVRDQVQPVTWRAFWLTAVEQQAASSVAKELHISVASVYTAKCRMLSRIRTEIEAFESDSSKSQSRD